MPNEITVYAPSNLDELLEFSKMLSTSALVPTNYQAKPQDILVALQMGSEVGLQPMQALQSIAVINGRPAVYGDAALAIAYTHPKFEGVEESISGEGESRVATCIARRKGQPPVTSTFSVADARKAGLWDERETIPKRNGTGTVRNPSPWYNYPERMLQMRARGFALRDAVPDALRGMVIYEEALDTPSPKDVAGEHTFESAKDQPANRDDTLAATLAPSGDDEGPTTDNDKASVTPEAEPVADPLPKSDDQLIATSFAESINRIEQYDEANVLQKEITTAFDDGSIGADQAQMLKGLIGAKVKQLKGQP